MDAIIAAVLVTSAVILSLSLLVLAARQWLVPAGTASVLVNGRKTLQVSCGDKLLWALAANGVQLPAACGGRGSCGQCRLIVASGGGPMLPTERNHLSRRDAAAGARLACMVTVRRDLEVRVPDSALESRRWAGTVRSSRSITTYLREIVIALPEGESMTSEAGDYVTVEAPPGTTRFDSFDLPPGVREAWSHAGLTGLSVTRAEPTVRAYSMANPPQQSDIVTLVVRIATPPASAPHAPPGKVSSWMFGLRPGDAIALAGPFGEFHARESDSEMVLIGGGAGIAPLRAIILDQLAGRRTARRISFWYGARNEEELCYREEFDGLAERFDNFSWHVALSDRTVDPGWSGYRGFIHTVVHDHYLAGHPRPEAAEYYLCGPPLMASAVVAVLQDLGVEEDHVFFDDFGS
jgi:Na+-transporting NADH:ubiquinone oxidoreductase subunit F